MQSIPSFDVADSDADILRFVGFSYRTIYVELNSCTYPEQPNIAVITNGIVTRICSLTAASTV